MTEICVEMEVLLSTMFLALLQPSWPNSGRSQFWTLSTLISTHIPPWHSPVDLPHPTYRPWQVPCKAAPIPPGPAGSLFWVRHPFKATPAPSHRARSSGQNWHPSKQILPRGQGVASLAYQNTHGSCGQATQPAVPGANPTH